jgi:hypothetical protein
LEELGLEKSEEQGNEQAGRDDARERRERTHRGLASSRRQSRTRPTLDPKKASVRPR